MCPVCRMMVYSKPLYNTLELLMMGIVVPKHVEQAIRSAIKTSVASSWHFISTFSLISLNAFNSGTEGI